MATTPLALWQQEQQLSCFYAIGIVWCHADEHETKRRKFIILSLQLSPRELSSRIILIGVRIRIDMRKTVEPIMQIIPFGAVSTFAVGQPYLVPLLFLFPLARLFLFRWIHAVVISFYEARSR